MYKKNDSTYIFWVRGLFNFSLRFPLYKCEITNEIKVLGKQKFEIRQIQSVKMVYSVKAPPSIEISYSSERKNKFISLSPIDPLYPYRVSFSENKTLLELIQNIQNGKDFYIEKNPYLRAISSLKDADQQKYENTSWDSNVNPWVYYDKYRERKPIGKMISEIILTLLVTSIIIIFMIFLVGGFK